VAPLLPPEDCALIVTSRRRIAIAGLSRIDLDLLAPDEAIGLLTSIVGGARATTAELSRIAELCGLLPLALRVAGMFLTANPHRSAAEFIIALADERERLTRLRLEGNATLDVAASLALSVRDLRRTRPDLAEQWHELAAFPASFDTDAAAAVCAQPVEETRDALGVLLSRSMVLYDPAQRRWSLHDLMRDLATGQVTSALEIPADLALRHSAARRRHAEHYQLVLEAADDIYIVGAEHTQSGLALFDLERRNIETGQEWAASNGSADSAAARLCLSYSNCGPNIIDLRHHPRQRISWLETAAAKARELDDRAEESAALRNLGQAHADLGDSDRAIEFYERGLLIAREIGNRTLEGNALGSLGNAYRRLGDLHRAIELFEQVIAAAREMGDRRTEAITLNNVGLAYADLGDYSRASRSYEDALHRLREIGDLRSLGMVLGNLGLARAAGGNFVGAIDFHEQNLTIARSIGDSAGECAALGSLGVAFKNLGKLQLAIEHHKQALLIARQTNDRYREGHALGNLGLAHQALGEPTRAIEFFRAALEIFEAVKSPHAAQARAAIANLEK
jgi:tetratricopeptide (TPR) repeat protein